MQAENEKKWEVVAIQEELRQLGYSKWRDKATGISCIEPPTVVIPAGEFLMGSDKSKDSLAVSHELPQHLVYVGPYEIAKYPLTVAEYEMYIAATGKTMPDAEELYAMYIAFLESIDETWDEEYIQALMQKFQWTELRKQPDYPMIFLTWYDITAYAKWLSEVTGEKWRLPSEAEWEKAARGTDGRIYPWGDEWDVNKASAPSSIMPLEFMPVGRHSQGASPYGVMDLVGSVIEWTNTAYKAYPYNATDGRENDQSQRGRVARGNCWSNNIRSMRIANRNGYSMDHFEFNYGGRLARDV